MYNWRKRSTSPGDRPDNSINARPSSSNTVLKTRIIENWREHSMPNTSSPRSAYFHRHQAPNLKNFTVNPINFGLQRESRGAFWQMRDLIGLYNKNQNKIVLELIEKLDDFSELLSSYLEPNKIVLIVSILSKVSSCNFKAAKFTVFKVAINGSFLQSLEKYIGLLKLQERENRERSKYFWSNPEEFVANLILVCDSFIDIIPNDYYDILHKLLKVIIEFIPCLREETNVEERQKTKSNIKSLMQKLELCEEHPEREIGTFRIYPNRAEILSRICGLGISYFVEEKYRHVKDYLDNQVRLLKDRFIAELQRTIAQCIIERIWDPKNHEQRLTIIKYPDVVFRSMEFNCDGEDLGVIVSFSKKEDFQQIFSPRSRCFKRGSVVCFSNDNFYTFFFGSVIKRDCKQHHLIIRVEPEYNIYQTNVPYTMIECNVYLYEYCDFLKALPCMSEVNFPLKSYLIDSVSKVEAPGYLDSTSSLHLVQGGRVDVFGSNWPSPDELKLDPSQYCAFKAALTQKLVMIQGAPGTGKTYLGLQIVKTLLHETNQKLWHNEAPILIVCWSHQVLDQFLEGLISTTNRIIRVGQKCKSDKLVNFTLSRVRKRSSVSHNVLMELKEKMKHLLKQLKEYQDCLNKINHFNYILNFSKFGSIDENVKGSWFSCASTDRMLTWIFDEGSQHLHSSEISEIIKNVMEEEKQLDSEKDNATFGEQRNISDKVGPTILWSKSNVWNQIIRITKTLQKMESSSNNKSDRQNELETLLTHLWQNYQYFKMKMSHRGSTQTVSKPKNVDYQSPHSMDPSDRWNLYFYWITLYKEFAEKKFLELQSEHRRLSQKITDIRNMLDLEIMKGALVLGMTFPIFARLQATLQSLKCRIVVVEEACNVPESHIIVSLTKYCENLILFDHEQELFPSVGKKVAPAPNIMERMMRNGMECHVLRVQHRTRPKMIELLIPHNYSELENTVKYIPPILGIASCCYFIHHVYHDHEKYRSKVNLYEAKYLINLAVYLRQVGHPAKDITILTPYFGQTEILYDESKRHEDLLEDVQICTLDKYLNKECKIVLLSLVRNNTEGHIGRFRFDDVIIFALSRAKEALYIMGNIDLLCENSKLWRSIKEVLVKQNCVGSFLPVCCKVNPNHVTQIKEANDFEEVGGKVCNKICERLLRCGHRCSQSCHFMEDGHFATECTELCSK